MKNTTSTKQNNDALRKAFGRQLRQIRGFDLTQKQFAEKLGVTQSMLSRLEKGYTDPPLYVLTRLSEISGKSIDEVVRGLGPEGKKGGNSWPSRA